MMRIIINTFFLLLVILAFSNSSALAQRRIDTKMLEAFNKYMEEHPLLKDGDADFSIQMAPAKWTGESAVILSQKTTFGFDRKGMSVGKRIGRNIWGIIFALPTLGTSLYYANASSETKILVEESERRKLLLNDKYALEQYSILYFRLDRNGDAFAARVIKKNGDIEKVDLADAVTVDDISNVPSVFRSYTDDRFSAFYRPDYYKIAVPGLEEGDILEYEFRNNNVRAYSNNPDYKEFDPIYFICNRELPVAKQVIEVVTEDDRYYIGYKSNKGAPDFASTNTGDKKVYRWEDREREKSTDTRFLNEFTEQPSVKFQVLYAKSSNKKFVWFNDAEDMKRDMSPEELAEKAKNFWFNPKLANGGEYNTGLGSNESVAQGIYKQLKKKGIADANDEEYIRKAYYVIRARTLYRNWPDYSFARIFSLLLSYNKIDHDIVVTTYNTKTSVARVAFTQELAWVIKWKNKYYVNPDNHLNPEEMPMYLAGNDGVRFNYNNAKSTGIAEQIAAGDTLSNTLQVNLLASLDASGLNMNIERTTEAKGMVKDDVIEEALALVPFMENDFRNYDGMSMWEGLDRRAEEKAVEDFNNQKKEWKEEKPKLMKESVANEYGFKVEQYNSFKLVQDGRAIKKKSLKYTDNFVLGDMVAQAGEDKVIALPALVSGQTKLRKEERSRNLPVDIRYARSLQWNFNFTIPAGYTVLGLEELQRNLKNSCGSFTVRTKVDGSTLYIEVVKRYAQRYFDNKNWPQMIELLDQSYNFSQSKIILKKL